MKYFIDTEFIEGFHKPLFGKRRHFIDLISIGIVCEDGREYYAVSKDFNEKDAGEWVKENVISKIHTELYRKESVYAKTYHSESLTFKNLQKWHGKSNKQIAEEIFQFCTDDVLSIEKAAHYNVVKEGIEFYGYYADYDWVLFCSLFGRMMDLPKGFPMYCRDLKQMMDENGLTSEWKKQYCPDPSDEHNALADAKWNQQLYNAITEQINKGGKP